MCLALIALKQHPQYPIIILANRDEFYNRPATPAHYWQDNPDIFAGKDLIAGGTWLGATTKKRFAFVTNYRNPEAYDKSLLSRGALVKDYLVGTLSPEAYVATIQKTAQEYNLFNLIIGDLHEVIYYSNVENKAIKLSDGVYGLSNHLLDTPWPKLLRTKELFSQKQSELIKQTEPDAIANILFPILTDTTPAPDGLLPQTGVSLEMEKALSSIFVSVPEYQYGTRSSTLLLGSPKHFYFFEKTFINEKIIADQRIHFE